MYDSLSIKWALRSVEEEIQTQNLNIYKINEVIINKLKKTFHKWINKLFSEWK